MVLGLGHFLPFFSGQEVVYFLVSDLDALINVAALDALDDHLAANLFALPNFEYGLALDPSLPILPVASGMSGSGNLTITAPIGNDPSFIGVSVFFQGLRVQPNLTGDFTRYAEASVF